MTIKIDTSNSSLDLIKGILEKKTNLPTTIEWDIYSTDVNYVKQRHQCVVVKKSGTNGVKINLPENGIATVVPVIPNAFLREFDKGGITQLVYKLIFGSQKMKFTEEIASYIQKQ